MITIVDHEGRTSAGLTEQQYCLLDCIKQTIDANLVSEGWGTFTWATIAQQMGYTKQAILYQKSILVKRGLLEEHPQNNRMRKITQAAKKLFAVRDERVKNQLSNFTKTQ